MKIKKKWIVSVLVIIFIILFLWVLKNSIATVYLTKKLKTTASFSNVSISSNKMILSNFKIINPNRTNSKYAFVAERIQVNYSLSKLMTSPSIVDNILIENVKLNIDCDDPVCNTNNWTIILNKVNEEEAKKSNREIIVSSMIVKNMDVQINGAGLNLLNSTSSGTKNAHIDSIEFKNISSKKGFPTQQLAQAIFRSSGLQDYLKGLMQPLEQLGPDGTMKGIMEPFKSIGQ